MGFIMQRNEFRQRPELAKQYNVSRITVRRAVDDLVSQGLVEKKQGKGTFICRQKFAKDIKNLQSFSEMCRHMNMKPGGTDA